MLKKNICDLTYAANGCGNDSIKRRRMFPDDVGIIAMEIYFPRQYVDQAQLEKFDSVSEVIFLDINVYCRTVGTNVGFYFIFAFSFLKYV